MKMTVACLLIVVLISVTASASAALVCTVKPYNGAEQGILTRPGKSSEFYSLIQNNLYEEAARCCVACIAPVGTKVIITDQGFASHTVRVLEGSSRGCVGDLPAEFVGNCK